MNERSEKKNTATEGLMWLSRGLLFTHQSLHAEQSDPNIELSKAFTKGYEASLKQHHNFLVKGIFSIAMNACPRRTDFYAKLAADTESSGASAVSAETVSQALDKWLEGLDKVVMQMQKVYKENGYGKL